MYHAGEAAMRSRAYAEACFKVQLSIAMLRPFDEYKENCLRNKVAETTRDDTAGRRRMKRAALQKS